ncbi:MAG: HEAT repeat domain-containing protein [Caldisericia bacterium]|nr:HEAT repeat domain-containing protein [Caldisericia bacterium]MDD4615237.1 HEAT repeat domain-containing protein [Caldisericia bacterium]
MKEELIGILIENGDIAGLLGLLRDPRYPYRCEIIQALSRMKDKEVFQALMGVLRSDPKEDVRSCAAETLGLMKNISALTPLIMALKDPSGMVRSRAAQGLGRLGDNRAGTQLIQCLKDPHPTVRRNAILALGVMQYTKAFANLCELLEDEDLYVRSAAAGSIGRLGSQKGIPILKKVLLDPSDKMVRSAIEGLGRLVFQESLDVLNAFQETNTCPPRVEDVLRQAIQRLHVKLNQQEMQDIVTDMKQNDANTTYKSFKEMIEKINDEEL